MLQAVLLMIKPYHENQMVHVSTSRPRRRIRTRRHGNTRLVFVLAGLIGRVPSATSGERQSASRLRHSEMWQTWISQAALCLTQTVSACGKAARRERGGKVILWRDQWVEHGRNPPTSTSSRPGATCLSCTHFNNTPQRGRVMSALARQTHASGATLCVLCSDQVCAVQDKLADAVPGLPRSSWQDLWDTEPDSYSSSLFRPQQWFHSALWFCYTRQRLSTVCLCIILRQTQNYQLSVATACLQPDCKWVLFLIKLFWRPSFTNFPHQLEITWLCNNGVQEKSNPRCSPSLSCLVALQWHYKDMRTCSVQLFSRWVRTFFQPFSLMHVSTLTCKEGVIIRLNGVYKRLMSQ